MEPRLPDYPSQILEVALEDLEKCEKDPKFSINMSTWSRVGLDGVCEVCLGGSVLAKTIGKMPVRGSCITPANLGDSRLERTLLFIDGCRPNFIDREPVQFVVRLSNIIMDPSWDLVKRVVERAQSIEFLAYGKDPDGFKEFIRWLIEEFKKEDL